VGTLGQGGGAAATGVPFEKTRNVLSAVVEWVETGVTPEYVEGTKFVNDTVGLGVEFTGSYCRYPMRNVYVGGDRRDAMSWECI